MTHGERVMFIWQALHMPVHDEKASIEQRARWAYERAHDV